jgi:hypothetical protein
VHSSDLSVDLVEAECCTCYELEGLGDIAAELLCVGNFDIGHGDGGSE